MLCAGVVYENSRLNWSWDSFWGTLLVICYSSYEYKCWRFFFRFFNHLAVPVFLFHISLPYGTMLNSFMKTKYIEFRTLHFLENVLFKTLVFYTCRTGPGQHNCTVKVFYFLHFLFDQTSFFLLFLYLVSFTQNLVINYFNFKIPCILPETKIFWPTLLLADIIHLPIN